jgi:antitoxin PrlF
MAETSPFQAESTLTDRYQTTVPDNVRKVLGLNKRDKILYTIQPNGQVTMSKADQEDNDPALGKFLSFLAQDIENNPQHIHPITSDLFNRAQSLVAGIDVDLDARLSDEDE